jgi:hypothetical protein
MKSSLLLSLSLLLCADRDARSQTQASLETSGAFVAWAGYFGGSVGRVENSIPARTPITVSQTVSATTGGGQGSATLTPLAGISARVSAGGSGSGQMQPGGGANGVATWTLTGGGYGTLTIDLSAAIDAVATQGGASVQVTGPGINEGAQASVGLPPVTRHIQRLIRFPGTFVLSISVSGAATATAIRTSSAGAGATVDFQPLALPPVQQQSFGSDCGASLTVTDTTTTTQHSVDIVTTGAQANGLVVLVIGVRRTSIPFPGSPCTLVVEPATAVLLTADANGAAPLRVPLPGPLQTIPIDLQSIAIAAAVRASAGVEIAFADY